MRLIEAQAKAVFREAGLKVPEGEVVSRPEQAREVARRLGPVAVKAQIPLGGRGKAGGIRIARTPEEAEQAASALLGSRVRDVVVERLLVEQAVDIQAEFYLSFSLDRSRGQLVGIFSTAGGVDIEEVAETTPERIAKEWVDPCLGLCPFQARRLLQRGGAPPESRRELERFVRTLYELAVSKDAQLVEINPLALTRSGELVALDGKVEVDDNALFRHPELAALRSEQADHPLEQRARQEGLAYVKLSGTVGIIGNGAGLVMATLDMVQREGGRPANFLDIGGGARAEVVERALRVVLEDPDVRAVLINIFGGITRGDEVARGVLQALAALGGARVPVVVRLAGTRAEEGLQLLSGSGLHSAATFQEAARLAVQLAGSSQQGRGAAT